jgi:hypothetical protein
MASKFDIELERVLKLIKNIKSLNEILKNIQDLQAIFNNSLDNLDITSNNTIIIQCDKFTRTIEKGIVEVFKYDENYWFEFSGYNMMDKNAYYSALIKLRKEADSYQNLGDGFKGLMMLLETTRVMNFLEKIGLLRHFPSALAIEEIHRKEVLDRIKFLRLKIEKIREKINKVVDELDKNWIIH